MNLEDTWTNCLAMWKWIAEQGQTKVWNVKKLKKTWCKQQNFKVRHDCFFCNYNGSHIDCSRCPGTLVSSRFKCFNNAYFWGDHPTKFYKKLLKLNEKRLCLKKNT